MNCPFIPCCTEYNFLVDRGDRCRTQVEIVRRAMALVEKQEVEENDFE